LVDTHQKSGSGLLENWPCDDLSKYVALAKSFGFMVALAGSLTPKAIARVVAMEPDYVGVRGAVCRNGRSGTLDAGRIREVRRLLEVSNGYRVRAFA
jgi:dihydroneopterin aldolase